MRIYSALFFPLTGFYQGAEWSITPGDNDVTDEVGEMLTSDKRFEKFFQLDQLIEGHNASRRDLEMFLAPPDRRSITDLCAKATTIPDNQVIDGTFRVDLSDPLGSYDRVMRRGIDKLAAQYGDVEQMLQQLKQQVVTG